MGYVFLSPQRVFSEIPVYNCLPIPLSAMFTSLMELWPDFLPAICHIIVTSGQNEKCQNSLGHFVVYLSAGIIMPIICQISVVGGAVYLCEESTCMFSHEMFSECDLGFSCSWSTDHSVTTCRSQFFIVMCSSI